MFGLFEGNANSTSALDLLKADHDEVEKLFDEYEDRKEDGEAEAKEDIVEAICKALEVHAQLEEELFYPALRKVEGLEDLLDEATVEHQSLKDLIAQLEASTPDDMLYDAKVKVLSEYVKHHVREEEGELFPKARSSDLDLDALGRKMASRKDELQQGAAIPAIEEEAATRIPAARGRGATASKRATKKASSARKTPPVPPSSRKSAAKSANGKRATARSR